MEVRCEIGVCVEVRCEIGECVWRRVIVFGYRGVCVK